MDNDKTIALINDHRAACGREPVASHPDPAAELERIGELAQYGEDPFTHEDGIDDQAPPFSAAKTYRVTLTEEQYGLLKDAVDAAADEVEEGPWAGLWKACADAEVL